jgi:Thioredoxin
MNKGKKDLSIDPFYTIDDDDSNSLNVHRSPASWRVRGHGTYEDIPSEDVAISFFDLTKKHRRLIVHFYSSDSAECETMHTHLNLIAKQHLETKFVKLDMSEHVNGNSAKSFLKEKLGIEVYPTLVLIKERKQIHHLKGFSEVGGNTFSTLTLKDVLAKHGLLKLSSAEIMRLSSATKQDNPVTAYQHETNNDSKVAYPPIVDKNDTSVGWGPLPPIAYYAPTLLGIGVGQNTKEIVDESSHEKNDCTSVDLEVASNEYAQQDRKQRNSVFQRLRQPLSTFVGMASTVKSKISNLSAQEMLPNLEVWKRQTHPNTSPTPFLNDSAADYKLENTDDNLNDNQQSLKLIPVASSVSCWAVILGVMITILALLAVPLTKLVRGNANNMYKRTIQVAFVGNSLQFYNDFPRFLEAISANHIVQNSCLHDNTTIANMMYSGNGMLKKFRTENAMIEGSDGSLFDFGACTVHQLLLGNDPYLFGNWKKYAKPTIGAEYSGAYSDGLNPCYNNSDYRSYVTKEFRSNPPQWDFVVMNDDITATFMDETRQQSLTSLSTSFVSIFGKIGAIPVLLESPVYWTSFQNMSQFVDVPTFTSQTYEGYQEYAAMLDFYLPETQKSRIAPVGIAFLTVWEEDYKLWTKLFHYDEIHLSPHGTFLQGCILHYTLFGHLPSTEVALPDSISSLFTKARYMQPPTHHRREWPTRDEAIYLYDTAIRVVKEGYFPSSFIK